MKIVDIHEEKLIHGNTAIKRSINYLIEQYPEYKVNVFGRSPEDQQKFDCMYEQENRCRVMHDAEGHAEKIVWHDEDYAWFLLRWS